MLHNGNFGTQPSLSKIWFEKHVIQKFKSYSKFLCTVYCSDLHTSCKILLSADAIIRLALLPTACRILSEAKADHCSFCDKNQISQQVDLLQTDRK